MRNYAFIDYATQGYIALVGLIVLLCHQGRVPLWPVLVAAHSVGLVLVHGLIQAHAARPQNRVLGFLRHFYPVFFYTGFYRETGTLNQMLITGYLDPFFIRLEEQIFGGQPCLVLMELLPNVLISELLYASYFSYYLMIVGVGLALFWRNRAHFFHYVSVVSFVFYACYLIYIFTPVMGPRIFYRAVEGFELPAAFLPAHVPPFPASVEAGPFFRLMAWIYQVFEAPGAAFPSSHVAVALTTLYFSFRYLPRIRHAHLVVVLLLCVSTVYCRYHYAVDVVAGILSAAVLIPAGNGLFRRFEMPAFAARAPVPFRAEPKRAVAETPRRVQ